MSTVILLWKRTEGIFIPRQNSRFWILEHVVCNCSPSVSHGIYKSFPKPFRTAVVLHHPWKPVKTTNCFTSHQKASQNCNCFTSPRKPVRTATVNCYMSPQEASQNCNSQWQLFHIIKPFRTVDCFMSPQKTSQNCNSRQFHITHHPRKPVETTTVNCFTSPQKTSQNCNNHLFQSPQKASHNCQSTVLFHVTPESQSQLHLCHAIQLFNHFPGASHHFHKSTSSGGTHIHKWLQKATAKEVKHF